MHKGAVDQGIDPAEVLDGLVRQVFALRLVGDVGHHFQHLAVSAKFQNALFCFIQFRRGTCAEDHRLGAFARGMDRKLDPQPRTDARDHDNLVSHQHGNTPVRVTCLG
ncbi:hypothetical protein D3C76_1567830 [compost metagenome]